MESSMAKKLWHMVHIVYYMLRKGFAPKRKLMMDLHLLLKSGKIAGKALGNLLTFNHHHHPHRRRRDGGFSCRSVDPTLSFYDPREVEFSCSNTPSYPSFLVAKRRRHRRRIDDDDDDDEASSAAVAAIARAFEMLDNDDDDGAESPAKVDREAEEFIRRFYEQLWRQKITGLDQGSPFAS